MDDLISRQAAIDEVVNLWADKPFWNPALVEIKDCIEKLPSADPGLDEWCTDCKEYDRDKHRCPRWNRVTRETVEELRERQNGKWIYCEDMCGVDGYRCDKCGFHVPWDYKHKFIDFIKEYHFCPNCGADMRGEHDD